MAAVSGEAVWQFVKDDTGHRAWFGSEIVVVPHQYDFASLGVLYNFVESAHVLLASFLAAAGVCCWSVCHIYQVAGMLVSSFVHLKPNS